MSDDNGTAKALLREFAASARLALATLTVCSLIYGWAVWAFAQACVPWHAEGSLICDRHGNCIGSALLAQGFSRAEYLWPRPSACDFNAAASGGSNLSPGNPALRTRAEALASKMGADGGRRLPADLATASGSGLDPHITLAAATYQAARVARARGLTLADVERVLDACAERTGGWLTPAPVVSVLRVNQALNQRSQRDER